MNLFNKKFVYFMWDDVLEGKECFVANNINAIINGVNLNEKLYLKPMSKSEFDKWTFAYYDPLYELKTAYGKGKHVQIWNNLCNKWLDIDPQTLYLDHAATGKYRILEEAEQPKRMTYRQLAEWLAKGNGQYVHIGNVNVRRVDFEYQNEIDGLEITDVYRIRRWGSDEWIEPTVGVYKEDCE